MKANELMFKPGLMEGQRVLVTGGGTGLGRVMAEACLALGAQVGQMLAEKNITVIYGAGGTGVCLYHVLSGGASPN